MRLLVLVALVPLFLYGSNASASTKGKLWIYTCGNFQFKRTIALRSSHKWERGFGDSSLAGRSCSTIVNLKHFEDPDTSPSTTRRGSPWRGWPTSGTSGRRGGPPWRPRCSPGTARCRCRRGRGSSRALLNSGWSMRSLLCRDDFFLIHDS